MNLSNELLVKIYLNLNLFVLYFQVIENVIIVDYCYRNKGEQQEKQHVLGKRKRSLQSLKHDGLLAKEKCTHSSCPKASNLCKNSCRST
jgi:hypothetical protein